MCEMGRLHQTIVTAHILELKKMEPLTHAFNNNDETLCHMGGGVWKTDFPGTELFVSVGFFNNLMLDMPGNLLVHPGYIRTEADVKHKLKFVRVHLALR